MTNRRCLTCGSDRIHRSKRRNTLEKVISWTGATMGRCHECNTRFVQFGRSLIRTKDLCLVRDRLIVVGMMAVATTLVLGAILWFSHTQAKPDGDSGLYRPVAPHSSLVRADA